MLFVDRHQWRGGELGRGRGGKGNAYLWAVLVVEADIRDDLSGLQSPISRFAPRIVLEVFENRKINVLVHGFGRTDRFLSAGQCLFDAGQLHGNRLAIEVGLGAAPRSDAHTSELQSLIP